MERSRIFVATAAIAAAAIVAGCGTTPARPPVDEHKAEAASPPRNPPAERKVTRAGDYLIYPLKWKRADEAAAELYAALYPKYGPYLQIVPDYDTNSLLIYLPPRAARFQQNIHYEPSEAAY